MLTLYTLQMGQRHAAAKEGIMLLDTTVKTGDRTFAPTWDMVRRFKAAPNDPMVQEEYRREYLDMMRSSYVNLKQRWHDVLYSDAKIGVACYCTLVDGDPHKTFCHRYQLVDMFLKQAQHLKIPVVYAGEFIKEK